MAKLLAKGLTDSVELFDGSSADNTGHVLAGLGVYGLTAEHSRSVQRAVRFLRRTQHPGTGLWEGRWGINTLYGTTQAGIGLLRAGESPQSPYLLTAARTLMSFQNADGGFGESTLSYLDAGHHGRGTSTPTQTAWVLEFLCELGIREADAVSRRNLSSGNQERIGILARWFGCRDRTSWDFIHGISSVSQGLSGDGSGKLSESSMKPV